MLVGGQQRSQLFFVVAGHGEVDELERAPNLPEGHHKWTVKTINRSGAISDVSDQPIAYNREGAFLPPEPPWSGALPVQGRQRQGFESLRDADSDWCIQPFPLSGTRDSSPCR